MCPRIVCFLLFILLWNFSNSQSCSPVLFTFPNGDTICRNENFQIDNNFNSGDFEWDFCSGDLEREVVLGSTLTNPLFYFSLDIKLVKSDGVWHGFVVKRSGNKLFRLDFGESLKNSPNVVDLGVFSDFNSPNAIDIIKVDGSWYGLVGNIAGNNLVKLNFGNSLLSTPQTTTLYNILPSGHTKIVAIKFLENNGEVNAYILSNEAIQLGILSFSSIDSTPSFNIVTGATIGAGLSNLSIIKECDVYYGIAASRPYNYLKKISFGNDLITINGVSTLVNPNQPTRGKLVNEGGNFYYIFQLKSGEVKRLSFGDSMNNSFTSDSLTNVSSEAFGFDLVADSSKYYGFSISYTKNKLTRFDFMDSCSMKKPISKEKLPAVQYDSAGRYKISLKLSDALEINYYSKEIVVKNQTAPEVSLSSENQCVSAPIKFTTPSTGVTYSWDFDNDGIEDSNLQNPEYTFSTAGNYQVSLTINDGSCSNFTSKLIKIYPEPPVSNFTASETLVCTNSEITFTNTTDETGFDDVLAYEWDFNGEGTSTEKSPAFTFASAGMKTIRVKSKIPGCESALETIQIEVFEGPKSDFLASSYSICAGEIINFKDNSTNGAISYSWNFGDGFTSNQQNPSHLFGNAGNYNVKLTTTDSRGCKHSIEKEISVAALPQADFSYDNACFGSLGVRFSDVSTVENSDIVSWEWFVENEKISEEQNPLIEFDEAGVHTIRLLVRASSGCEMLVSKNVEIKTPPKPNFTSEIGCVGEKSLFKDLSNLAGEEITSWLWKIEDSVYSVQNPEHTFRNSGKYEIYLEVLASSLCSESITKEIEVLKEPQVNFSVSGACQNDVVTFTDESTVFENKIISRKWFLDGELVGSSSQVLLTDLKSGAYEIRLQLQNKMGCEYERTQTIQINSAPKAQLTANQYFAKLNDTLIFTNRSIGYDQIKWLLNGSEIGEEQDEKRIIFEEAGNYTVAVVGVTNQGCLDTTSLAILVADLKVDLEITDLEISGADGLNNLLVSIRNNSSLPLEKFKFELSVNNQIPFFETVPSPLNINEEKIIRLSTAVPISEHIDYLCVKIISPYDNFEDINPTNNEICKKIKPNVTLEGTFPNPTYDKLNFRFISDSDNNSITVRLIDDTGKIFLRQGINLKAGLVEKQLDISNLESGVYILLINLPNEQITQKIFKNE